MTTSTKALDKRPQTWEEVLGQPLANAVLVHNLREDQVHPAYLFAGLTGTGKTTCAQLLSRALQCEDRDPETQDPCQLCHNCQLTATLSHPDILIVDGASDRSIAFVRDTIKPFLQCNPMVGQWRIVIVDEAHQYPKDSISAFLTMLEDMPKRQGRSVVIFCTTEHEKVDPAIRNRCLSLNFAPIPPEELLKVAIAETGLPSDQLETLVEYAAGSLRTLWSHIEVIQAAMLTKDFKTSVQIYQALGWTTKQDRLAVWAAMLKNDPRVVSVAIDKLFGARTDSSSQMGKQFMNDVMGALALSDQPDKLYTALHILAVADGRKNNQHLRAALLQCTPLRIAAQVITGLRQDGAAPKVAPTVGQTTIEPTSTAKVVVKVPVPAKPVHVTKAPVPPVQATSPSVPSVPDAFASLM